MRSFVLVATIVSTLGCGNNYSPEDIATAQEKTLDIVYELDMTNIVCFNVDYGPPTSSYAYECWGETINGRASVTCNDRFCSVKPICD